MHKGKRKVLGKGLEALIPHDRNPREIERGTSTFLCPVEKLVPNSDQPRQRFDEQKLQELTESVRSRGVIHPLVVCQRDGAYQIVTGERRWRAAKLAGLKAVPVIVKDLNEAEMVELALIENIQREDLNPLEEAEAYRQLVEEHGLTQEHLAKRVGRQRSTVANFLRLLKLPPEARRYLLTGEISMGHARAILGVIGESDQTTLARRVIKEKLSVRECEELVHKVPGRKVKSRKRARKHQYSPDQYRLVESLQRKLGTKVDLRQGKRGGRMIIYYYSSEELDRIISLVEGS